MSLEEGLSSDMSLAVIASMLIFLGSQSSTNAKADSYKIVKTVQIWNQDHFEGRYEVDLSCLY